MTDAQYRAWIQKLPSALDGKSFSEWISELGEWRNPACHVRRAGESGIAFKAPFACIPITNQQHLYQHQHGELACLRKFTLDPSLICRLDAALPLEAERIAAEWFDTQKARYFARWTRETPEGRRWATAQQIDVMA